MPLQNRVLPDGQIAQAPWRGALMGNRGCLHQPDNTLGRARWRHRNWVCCVTEFRGRKRLPMPPPGSPTVYTALFFWDEATAFAAGHRPCGECRNQDYKFFKSLWSRAGLGANDAKAMDRALHDARVPVLKGEHPPQAASIRHLPDGVILRVGGRLGLLWEGAVLAWQDTGGYGPCIAPGSEDVEVLTPAPVIKIFEAGYRPFVRLRPEDRFTTAPR
ncbi:MAG: hypothetical protein AAGE80_03030 [Pseudomonadota bacterium]